VKGVAWDPIGTYLASQSDDRSVILWRCEDWTQVAKVTEPFTRSVGATFSLRPCWSPDGRALTTVNSHQGPTQTAAVLDRGDWKARSRVRVLRARRARKCGPASLSSDAPDAPRFGYAPAPLPRHAALLCVRWAQRARGCCALQHAHVPHAAVRHAPGLRARALLRRRGGQPGLHGVGVGHVAPAAGGGPQALLQKRASLCTQNTHTVCMGA
jgi:hypothetical protein